MNGLIILGTLAGIPIVLALLFRVSAVFLFLSVVAGNLLVLQVSDDASLALGMMVKGQNTTQITQLGLLILPTVLTLLFMRKTMSHTKFIFHLLPLIGAGVSLALFALPLLDADLQQQVFEHQYGTFLPDSQDAIVSGAALLALLLMWFTYRHKPDKKHGK